MLRPYQEPHVARLLQILRERRVAHDGSSVGTGKTFCGAQVAKELNVETLVICPLSVCESWRRVLETFGVHATVTNYEKAVRHYGKVMPWGKGSYFEFTKKWPLTIIDEAHRCGGDATLNSKMLVAAKRAGGMVLTLSATAASTLLKMKAIGYALGLHQLSDYRFWLMARGVREQEIKLRSGRVVRKLAISKEKDAEAMGRLHEEIFRSGNRGSRMRVEEIPDFPKTTIEVRILSDAPTAVAQLSDELQAFYRQRNILGTFSQDELAKLVFFRQASETAKIPHIVDMIEDALETSKVAVFCCFNRTVDELLTAAETNGWTAGFIRGEQTAGDRQKVVDAFQANKLDLVVCNIQAGGVGISLHDAVTQYPRTAIICPSWSAVELKQATGRVHRDGGGYSRQYLVYFGTGIEARVAASVQRKLDCLSILNDAELSGEFDHQSEKPAALL